MIARFFFYFGPFPKPRSVMMRPTPFENLRNLHFDLSNLSPTNCFKLIPLTKPFFFWS